MGVEIPDGLDPETQKLIDHVDAQVDDCITAIIEENGRIYQTLGASGDPTAEALEILREPIKNLMRVSVLNEQSPHVVVAALSSVFTTMMVNMMQALGGDPGAIFTKLKEAFNDANKPRH